MSGLVLRARRGLIDRIALLDQTLVARRRLGIAIRRRQARKKHAPRQAIATWLTRLLSDGFAALGE